MTENNELENTGIPERIPEPWESAPNNMIYPDNIDQETGRLGSYTLSAEMAYRLGKFENGIPLTEVEFSDIDDWPWVKELCPMKTKEDLLKDRYRLEITQLKKALSDTDYKAIKFAEGQISEEDYASVRAERQGYRDRINYLEGLL
jgi:hypothetical protein